MRAEMRAADPAFAMARGLLPSSVALASADPLAAETGLLPEEQAAVARAVPKRRREFAAGRRAAREALAALGLPPLALPQGADRAPVWPEGVLGSLTHTLPRPGKTGPAACLAAAAWSGARVGEVRLLGLDAEDASPLEPALRGEVCAPADRLWLEARPEAERGRLAKILFCVKEAAWKAQAPLSGLLYGFDGMRAELVPAPDGRGGRFAAVFEIAAPPFRPGDRLEGAWAEGAGLVIAAIAPRA